jgi:hypothetical protein
MPTRRSPLVSDPARVLEPHRLSKGPIEPFRASFQVMPRRRCDLSEVGYSTTSIRAATPAQISDQWRSS